MVRDAPVCTCDECGHRWLAATAELPKRCAASKCKSSKWNKTREAGPLPGTVVDPIKYDPEKRSGFVIVDEPMSMAEAVKTYPMSKAPYPLGDRIPTGECYACKGKWR